MADSNRPDSAQQDELAQDDPFAELTRIMGHDPRSPASTAPQEAVDDDPADSLALELENELMGDMAGEGEQELPQTEAAGFDALAWPQPMGVDTAASDDQEFESTLEALLDEPFEESPEIAETADQPQDEDTAYTDREQELAALESNFASADDGSETMPAQDWQAEMDSFEEMEPAAETEDHAALTETEADLPVEEAGSPFDYTRAADERAEFLSADEPEIAPAEQPVEQEPVHAEPWPVSTFAPQTFAAGGMSYSDGDEAVAPSGYGGNEPPEIDTVDVPGEAVAVADSLDVPDVPYREEVKPAAEFDEIEQILAGAFGETADPSGDAWAETKAPAYETHTPPPAYETDTPAAYEHEEDLGAAALGIASATGAGAAFAAAHPQDDAARPQDDFVYDDNWRPAEQEMEPLAPAPGTEPPVEPRRSYFAAPLLLGAAVLAGVVVLAGAALLTFSFGGGDEAEPTVVAANDSPVKVKPEDPGGVEIPNQDNQVYKRVSGDSPDDVRPEQAELISTTEEPLELPGVRNAGLRLPSTDDRAESAGGQSTAAESDATAKIEDRLTANPPADEAAGGNGSGAVLEPRRVRTLVVRSDGTMVPHELPQPEQAASATAANSGTAGQGAQQAGTGSDAQTALAGRSAEAAEPTENPTVSIPRSGPIPPSRPANLATAPRQAATQTAPQQTNTQQQQQVAAANPQAQVTSLPSSEWSVQIASQPTVEGAQQSYQQLAQRFGNMLQGKGVNIVKADIEGKGTYYRVRIPSASKEEAIDLCTDLKSAGGSCFVSQ